MVALGWSPAIGLVPSAALATPGIGGSTNGQCHVYSSLAAAVASEDEVWVEGIVHETATAVVQAHDVWIHGSADHTACVAGAGTVVMDAPVRMLDVHPGLGLGLEGIVLEGGEADDGGTIRLQSGAILVIEDSTVELGHATNRGGCVYGVDSLVYMDPNSSIQGCSADGDGGGIALEGHPPVGVNVLFHLQDSTTSGDGGGLWSLSAPVCLWDAERNVAGGNGGGAWFGSLVPSTSYAFGPTSSNHADGAGGAIHIVDASTEVFAGGGVIGNTSGESGGGIYVSSGATLGLLADLDLGTNDAAWNGGGLFADGLAQIRGPHGGAFGMQGSGVVGNQEFGTMGACEDNVAGAIAIHGNRAGYQGGVVVNPARSGGGIAIMGASLDLGDPLSPTTVQENLATDSGGGIAVGDSGAVTVRDTTFDTNEAAIDGGGLFQRGAGTAVTLEDNVALVGNLAGADGGGVFVQGGALTAQALQVTGNDAIGYGGGVALTGGAVTLNLDTVVSENTAASGGGIAVAGGELDLDKGTVDANVATASGGGIQAIGGAVVLGGCIEEDGPCLSIADNEVSGAGGTGGGLATASGVHVELSRAIFDSNLAPTGAGIHIGGATDAVELTNVVVVGNQAAVGATWAIRVAAGTLDCSHCTIAHNARGLQVAATATALLYSSVVGENTVDVSGSPINDCSSISDPAVTVRDKGSSNPGKPFGNLSMIRDRCATGAVHDIVRIARPLDASYDRGAYEVAASCGDHVVDAGEQCDTGSASVLCDADCTWSDIIIPP